jgi:cobyrinic acid a,c-diamide synthase
LAEKTIAIARDEAFCFIYQANLDCLKNLGATLVYFSPLTDESLPEADAYWLPGGYPELHLQKISQNVRMQTSLKEAAAIGKPILAECGGMMALGQRLNDQPAFGLLPGDSVIQSTLQGLGTQHVAFADKSIGAHTFHYGAFDTTLLPAHVGRSQYGAGEAVYRHGSITASFLHFYFPSNPELAARFFLT